MKVITFKEFVLLPKGTIFVEYEPHCLGEISIKHNNCLDGDNVIDYFQSSFLIQPGWELDKDNIDKNITDKNDLNKFIFNHSNIQTRWAMFNYDQLYLIYEEEDLARMIKLIIEREKE